MKDLSQGNEGKLIFRFAVPMLLGNVFQQLYNVVDTIIVGRFIGKEALAAVGTSFPIIFMLISFIIGITMGFTIIISQYFGAREMDKVKRAINTLYIFVFMASILVSVAGSLLSTSIFRLVDLPEQIIPQARLFLIIYFSGMIFMFGYNGTSAILRGLGDSKTPLYFLIGSVVLNIFLDLLFVVGFGWGIQGVAFATVLSQAFAFLAQILYLNRYHSFLKFSLRELRFDPVIFRQGIRIGLPTGFQQTFVAAGMLALYWIVNQFGVTANAAYSTAGRIDSFAMMPAMSFSAALSTFVGQNLGANRPDRVKQGLRDTLLMTSGIALLISVGTVFFGRYLMMMFTLDQEVIELGRMYLIIIGSFYVVFTSMFIVQGVLRGAGDTFIPMLITLLSLWVVRVPVAWILSRSPEIGLLGVYWSIPIGWFFGLGLATLYYFSGRWRSKAVVRYDAAGKRV
ncbi:MAG: MATE family efflux transporter [Bacteroidetes bacterium]|nr:MAG: MATE family efflux transporter [Bacteroidota bacterium]